MKKVKLIIIGIIVLIVGTINGFAQTAIINPTGYSDENATGYFPFYTVGYYTNGVLSSNTRQDYTKGIIKFKVTSISPYLVGNTWYADINCTLSKTQSQINAGKGSFENPFRVYLFDDVEGWVETTSFKNTSTVTTYNWQQKGVNINYSVNLFRALIVVETGSKNYYYITEPISIKIGTPEIETYTSSIDFQNVPIGQTPEKTFQIKNTGTDKLTINSISSNNGYFTIKKENDYSYGTSISSFDIAANTYTTIYVKFSPTAQGLQNGNINISSNDADESSLNISCSGTGTYTPKPAVFGVSYTTPIPNPVPANGYTFNFSVTNGGDAILYWNVTKPSDITVAPIQNVAGNSYVNVAITIPKNNAYTERNFDVYVYNTENSGQNYTFSFKQAGQNQPQPPIVNIESPSGSVSSASQTVVINASDPDGSVTKVEVSTDNQQTWKLATYNSSTQRYTFPITLTEGVKTTIFARATDNQANVKVSNPVDITYTNACKIVATPTEVKFIGSTKTSATFSWKGNSNKYHISYREKGTSQWINISCRELVNGFYTYPDNNNQTALLPGKVYEFSVAGTINDCDCWSGNCNCTNYSIPIDFSTKGDLVPITLKGTIYNTGFSYEQGNFSKELFDNVDVKIEGGGVTIDLPSVSKTFTWDLDKEGQYIVTAKTKDGVYGCIETINVVRGQTATVELNIPKKLIESINYHKQKLSNVTYFPYGSTERGFNLGTYVSTNTGSYNTVPIQNAVNSYKILKNQSTNLNKLAQLYLGILQISISTYKSIDFICIASESEVDIALTATKIYAGRMQGMKTSESIINAYDLKGHDFLINQTSNFVKEFTVATGSLSQNKKDEIINQVTFGTKVGLGLAQFNDLIDLTKKKLIEGFATDNVQLEVNRRKAFIDQVIQVSNNRNVDLQFLANVSMEIRSFQSNVQNAINNFANKVATDEANSGFKAAAADFQAAYEEFQKINFSNPESALYAIKNYYDAVAKITGFTKTANYIENIHLGLVAKSVTYDESIRKFMKSYYSTSQKKNGIITTDNKFTEIYLNEITANTEKAIINYNNALSSFVQDIKANKFSQAVISYQILTNMDAKLNIALDTAYYPISSALVVMDTTFVTTIPNLLFNFKFGTYINRANLYSYTSLYPIDSLNQENNNSIVEQANLVSQCHLAIKNELSSIFSTVKTLSVPANLTVITDNIPILMPTENTFKGKIAFQNIGATDAENLYIKVSNNFNSSLDSVYIGKFPVGKVDSIFITVQALKTDTMFASYNISFIYNDIVKSYNRSIDKSTLNVSDLDNNSIASILAINANDTLLLKANISSLYSVQWYKNDIQISNAKYYYFAPKESGIYYYKAYNSGYTIESNRVEINICKKYIEISKNSDVKTLCIEGTVSFADNTQIQVRRYNKDWGTEYTPLSETFEFKNLTGTPITALNVAMVLEQMNAPTLENSYLLIKYDNGTIETVYPHQFDANRKYDPISQKIELKNLSFATIAEVVIMKRKCSAAISVTKQPIEQTVDAGSNISFTVEASSSENISYQWLRGKTEILNATTNTLTINNIAIADTGLIYCKLYNSCDTVYSTKVKLQIKQVVVLPDGLVALYNFTGNPNDESGNNLHGVIHGNVTPTTDRFGKANSAYYFNGTAQDWIEVADKPTLYLSNFTINVWISRAEGSSHYILGKGRDVIEGTYHVSFGGTSVGGYSGAGASNPTSLQNNQWYMITAVVDNSVGKIRYYQDGELITENNCPNFTTTTNFPLAIGRHITTGVGDNVFPYPFKGTIDDISIYNRVLTSSEIKKLYGIDNGNLITDDCVAYYPFDKDANDYSGNNNNGVESNVKHEEGKFGGCAKFFGVNSPSFIRVANSASLQFKECSFSFWARLDDKYGMDGWGGRSANGAHCMFSKDHDRTGFWSILGSNTDSIIYGWGNNGWSNLYFGTNGIVKANVGEWNHIVFTVSQTAIKTYVNGKLVSQNAITNPNFDRPNGRDLYFGRFSSYWYPFNGALDEFRIYNRPLTENEINSLYNSSKSQNPIVRITNEMPCNQTSSVSIIGSDLVDLGSVGMVIKYNATNAKYLGIKSTTLTNLLVNEPIAGELRLSWFNTNPGVNVLDTTLAVLNFELIGTETTLEFTSAECEFTDINGKIFQPVYVNGSIKKGAKPVINKQITDISVCENENVIFEVDASNVNTIIWQQKQGSNVWQNILEPTNYSVTSRVLKFESVKPIVSNTEIRAILTNVCPDTTNIAKLTVFEKPIVSISKLDTVHIKGQPITLQAGSPVGGWYTGKGIENNIFYPLKADTGLHTVTYHYQNVNGCVDSAKTEIYVTNKVHVKGIVAYRNTNETPLQNVSVTLKATGKPEITVFTNSKGEFFAALEDAEYKVTATSNTAWGGGTPTDCYLIEQAYVGLRGLDAFQKKVADVNGSGTVTPADAYLINQRYIKKNSKFVVNDWIFEDLTFTINSKDTTVTFKGLCAGDLDGSYQFPSTKKSGNVNQTYLVQNNLKSKKSLPVNKPFDIYIYADTIVNLNTQGIVLNCPEGLQIDSVSSKSLNFDYNMYYGEFLFGAYQINPLQFSKTEPLLKLTVTRTMDTPFEFTLGNQTEIADIAGHTLDSIKLVLPDENSIVSDVPTIETISNFNLYPNPNTGAFKVEWNNTDKGDVLIEVFDIQCKSVFTNKYRKLSDDFSQNIVLQSKGTFIVLITINNKTMNRKVIIE